MKPAAEVVFPLPLRRSFLYRIPEILETQAGVGKRVRAPFGRRILTGCLVGLTTDIPAGIPELKDILEIREDDPPLPREFLEFTRLLSRHFHSPRGELVFAALPDRLEDRPHRRVVLTPEGLRLLEEGKLRGRPRRAAVLLASGSHAPAHLGRKLEFRNIADLLSRMEKRGLVAFEVDRPRPAPRRRKDGRISSLQMELGFSDVRTDHPASSVIRAVGRRAFASFCLFGSRESRESVYRDLAGAVLRSGGTLLVLVPEVARIEGMAARLQSVLPAQRTAVLHGRLTAGQREDQWRRIRSGAASAVIGARSALLAPLENLRLAVIDDEEDEAYVQAESPTYEARAGVRIRCETAGAVAVYGSSTPSVETYHGALERGALVVLNGDPKSFRTALIETRSRGRLLDPRLVEKISERLKRSERIVVCATQRGYASFLACATCGARPLCRRCDIPLFYSKKDGRLVCRACRRDYPFDETCPTCGGKLIQGKAAGLQAVIEELEKTFPGAGTAAFDADTVRGRAAAARILEAFASGEKHILAGTALLARSDPLPRASLVAVLHPESLLYAPDFRASWKTYRYIRKAAGFVLDGEGAEFVVQTSLPGHPAVREAVEGTYESFFETEIAIRRRLGDPPFSSLMEITLQAENLRTLAGQSRTAAARLQERCDTMEIYGPAMAAAAKVRGMHRVQIVLKAPTETPLHEAAEDLLASLRGVKIHIALT